MAWVQADLDAIDAARLSWMVDMKGAKVVHLSDGTRTELGSLQEWREFRAMVARVVNSTPTYRRIVGRKGT